MPDIPFEKIGLYLDDSRKKMPDKNAYRKGVRERSFETGNHATAGRSMIFENVNETIYWELG